MNARTALSFSLPDPSRTARVSVVSAGVQSPSKSRALAAAVVKAIASRYPIEATFIDLADWGAEFGAVNTRDGLSPAAEAQFRAVETADLLIAGSPVYKGSYTGRFKHFFDLFPPTALTGLPVVLTATGGSDRHALVLEHQFRPLFGFFAALSLPTGVYGVDGDFQNGEVASPALIARINAAADEAALVLATDLRSTAQPEALRAAASA